MWSVYVNGAWCQVGTDEALTDWARVGRLRRETPVHHSSLSTTGLAGQVQFLEPIFGPAPIVHEMAQSARNWGIGALFCGVAAPIALFMGLRARAEIRETPSKFSNASDATLAIILGSLGVVLVLIGFAGFVVSSAAAPPSGPATRTVTPTTSR
jgi:hypothetical protein